MEKQTHYTDEKLFDYLDGKMNAEEMLFFEQVISHSPALQKRVEEQRLAENILKNFKTEEPSPAFVQNVMSKINEAPQSYTLSVRKGIVLSFGILVVSLLVAFLMQSGFFNSTGTLTIQRELGMLSKYMKEPMLSIPVNEKLIVNVIIMINLALGFLILDRAVLRPYFERRMRHS